MAKKPVDTTTDPDDVIDIPDEPEEEDADLDVDLEDLDDARHTGRGLRRRRR